jgi:hypothetical protein
MPTYNAAFSFLLLQFFPQITDLFLERLPREFVGVDLDFFVWTSWTILAPDEVYEILLHAHQRCATFVERFCKFLGICCLGVNIIANPMSALDIHSPAVITAGSTPTTFPPSACSAVLDFDSANTRTNSARRYNTILAMLAHSLIPASTIANYHPAASLPD